MLALAEQYLEFVEAARKVRLELAADYLVMAAWLTYLKSRLLLPEAPKGEEPPAADLAAALAERLRRLEAIRNAAEKLVNRPRLGRDLFLRGAPEGVTINRHSQFHASLYDLLTAYSSQRQKHALSRVTLKQRVVWSLAEAREAIERLAGHAVEWTRDGRHSVELLRDAGASPHGARLQLLRFAGAGARGADRVAAGQGVRPHLGARPAAARRRMK